MLEVLEVLEVLMVLKAKVQSASVDRQVERSESRLNIAAVALVSCRNVAYGQQIHIRSSNTATVTGFEYPDVLKL